VTTLDSSGQLYYRHSGQFSATGLTVAIVGGLISAVVLGFVYAYVDLYNPLMIVSFLATCGFAAGVGFVTGALMRWGHVRNNAMTKSVSFAVAVVALYAAWIFWIFAVAQKSEPGLVPFNPWELAIRPQVVWDIVREINDVGVWTIGGHVGSSSSGREPVKGIFLWLVWAAEAVAVLWIAVLVAVQMASSVPYCETCRKWCPKGKRLFSTPPGNDGVLKQRLEAKDFSYLIGLGPGGPLPSRWYEAYLHGCEGCRSLYTLTVNAVTMDINKKGEQKRTETVVVDKLLLSAKEFQTLTEMLERLNARAAAPAATGSAASDPQASAPADSAESPAESGN